MGVDEKEAPQTGRIGLGGAQNEAKNYHKLPESQPNVKPHVIAWKCERSNSPWNWIKDTPENRKKAIKAGAMFVTNTSFSKKPPRTSEEDLLNTVRRYGPFFIDIDRENLQAAKHDSQLILKYLTDLGVSEWAIRLFFSGSKGFHVEIPAEILGAEEGGPLLPLAYKWLASKTKAACGAEGMDLSIYSMGWGNMFRMANVKRENGYHKVPIYPNEIDLSDEEILEMAKVPRELDEEEFEEPERKEAMVELFQQCLGGVREIAQSKGVTQELDPEQKARLQEVGVPPCIEQVLKLEQKTDRLNFNKICFAILVPWATEKDLTLAQTMDLAKPLIGHYDSNSFPSQEARQGHIKSMFHYLQGGGYPFSCDVCLGTVNGLHCDGCPIDPETQLEMEERNSQAMYTTLENNHKNTDAQISQMLDSPKSPEFDSTNLVTAGARAREILRDKEPCGEFDLSVLPASLRDYVQYICSRTEASSIIILTSVICTLSAIIERRCYLPEGQYFNTLYANIWALSIAPSGHYKTTALNKGARLAWDSERKIREQISDLHEQLLTLEDNIPSKGNKQGEIKSQVKQIKNKIKELQALSPILPNRMSAEGLLEILAFGQAGTILASEFGEWLDNLGRTHNQGLKALITDLYDVPQQYSYKTKGGGLLVTERPYISICGVSTMAWVRENISLEDVGSGFFARFLLFYPPQTSIIPQALPSIRKPFDCTAENLLVEKLNQVSADHPMELSNDAARYFEQVHLGVYSALDQFDERTKELLNPYAKRWSPYILKLGMTLQITIDAGTVVSSEAIKAATTIVEYAIKSTAHLFQEELGESEFQRGCRSILDFIAKNGGHVPRAKLLSSHTLPGGAREYDETLDTLSQAGKIEISNAPKKEQVVRLI